MSKEKRPSSIFSFSVIFDIALVALLVFSLIFNFFKISLATENIFLFLSFLGLLPVLKSAIRALIKRRLTIDLLASVALIFSLLTREWMSAAFINLMLTFARLFDQYVEIKTKNIIFHLMKFRPEKVKIKRNGEDVEIPLSEVKAGDLIHVEMGERVPVDGTIINGKASLNESTLTGESELKVKTVGDKVFESTLNEAGFLEIKAEKVGEDSQFARVISLIEDASKSKAKMNSLSDKFSFIYIVIILISSFVIYFVSKDLRLVLAVLLVVCADDIAVAVPLGFTIGIATAARHGILIKGGEALERLSKIKFFITDKTGTLTKGKPKVMNIKIYGNYDEENVLQKLADLSDDSTHPMSKAIVRYCEEKNIHPKEINKFNEIPGEGVFGEIDGHEFFVGRTHFLKNQNISFVEKENQEIEDEKKQGYAVVGLSRDKKLIAIISLADEVKHNALDVVNKTKKLGVLKWVMLTGDNEKVAQKVAMSSGIDEFKANLKPEDKINFLKDFKTREKRVVAMMGDGVNDAAALSLADVSIAMGRIGSDAAIEASDVTIMRDNLETIPESMILAKNVLKIVKQNFIIWGVTNSIGLILVFAGVIGPKGASAFNFITDFFPILNTFRIGISSSSLSFPSRHLRDKLQR
jgi:Zn2+/Cd2+-exporting ATPase